MAKHRGDRPGKDHLAAHGQTVDIAHELIIHLRDVNHIMRFLYEGRASQKRILRGGRGHGYGQRCGETEDKITWENT